jgi:hypothetical protein
VCDPISDLIKWTPLVAAAAAWAGAFVAYLNARRSSQALRLAEQQEARRRPVLVPSLLRGYLHRVDEDRIYMFLLSVSNPSDSDNAIAQIDLRIEYRTSSNFLAAVYVPGVSLEHEMFGQDKQSCLDIPVRVDAHQTVTGWVSFRVKRALLEDRIVDTYVIVSTDSHGERASIETILPQELVYETEIKKS